MEKDKARDVYAGILELLSSEDNHDPDFWSDGELIYASTEYRANIIADFIDAIYGDSVAATGYFDPDEDERNDLVTKATGWHYIDVN